MKHLFSFQALRCDEIIQLYPVLSLLNSFQDPSKDQSHNKEDWVASEKYIDLGKAWSFKEIFKGSFLESIHFEGEMLKPYPVVHF